MSLISVVAFIGTSTIFALGVTLAVIYGKGSHVPKDRVEVINFMRQYTKGNFARGYQRRNYIGPKRTIIEYYPTDINTRKNQRIEVQRIVVENRKILDLPKGSLSNNISQRWLLPPTCNDFPNEFKETYFGKLLMAITEKINIDIEENDLVRSSMNTQSQILNEVKGLKLMREYLKTNTALNKDIVKKINNTDRPSPTHAFPQNKPYVPR